MEAVDGSRGGGGRLRGDVRRVHRHVRRGRSQRRENDVTQETIVALVTDVRVTPAGVAACSAESWATIRAFRALYRGFYRGRGGSITPTHLKHKH